MPARRLCLSFEWSQVATHFAQQVLGAHQVGFGSFKTALCFFFALAMLEHACCFFDDCASIFRTRIEHSINLSLAHDHVLLTTNAGIGKQFLHIEQTTLDTIDRVFTFATAEEHTTDRHFGELNRQQTSRVVDRQHDFCATECWTLGRACENDVIHLLTAYRRRCLGAKHPRNGINHVGLTRTVWPHHYGDTWFELHHGGISKRLEAFESQRFEKHVNRRE